MEFLGHKTLWFTNRQLSNGSDIGEGNISTKYFAEVDFSQLRFCCSTPVGALQFSLMQHEVLRVNWARLLSQNRILTSEDWTHVTISTGLAAIPQKGDVTCVQRGA